MSRYIDADALFAEFENVDWYNNADRDEIAERLVLQAPTIDAVSVVHGEWIKEGCAKGSEMCNQCGFVQFEGRVDNFCPNCGAHMKGADDD